MSDQGLYKDINSISFEKNNLEELKESIIRRKKIAILVGGIIFAIGFFKTTYERVFNPIYMSNFTLLISDPLSSSLDQKNSNNLFIEDIAVNKLNTDLPTLIDYLKSDYVLNTVASKFNKSSNAVRSNLVIEKSVKSQKFHSGGEGIIKIKYFDKKKNLSLQIIKNLSKHYLDISLKDPQQKLLDGLDFLNKQEPILREKYSSIQNQIVDFRQKNKLIEPAIEGGAIRNKQQDLQSKLIELYSYQERLENIKNKLSEGQIVTSRFQEILGSKTYPSEDLIISDFDQKLLNELLLVESELAKAKSKFTANSSIVKGLTSRIEQIQPQLVESQMEIIQTALILNRSEIKTIEKQIKELEILFSTKPALIKQYNSLDQKLKIASDNLSGLVSARENFLLKIAQNSITWKILEPPRLYPYPVSPSFKKGILLSLISAISLGSISALIRDKLDNIFHSPDEIENELKKIILTHIPFINLFDNLRKTKKSLLEVLNVSDSSEIKEEKRQRFFFQEALRNLFTSIRYLSSDKSLKTIAITSSIPEEGKSLMNCLLAITMSELNQKVLLIDADLRKPQIHKRFNLDNINGLSNYLIEGNSKLDDIIQKIDKYPNLSVIPSGIIPPDSTRLLSSKKFENFVESLNNNNDYDYVIFDTTPILGLADAALISKVIDGIILLVSVNGINKENAKRSLKRLKSTGANFLGIISNSVKQEYSTQKGYYGYKYQNYGYGYSTYSTYEIYDKYSNNEKDSTNELESQKKDDTVAEDTAYNNFIKKLTNKFIYRFNKFIKWLDS